MSTRKKLILVACSISCLVLGTLSGLFTMNEVQTWFKTLEKPSWNPPSWLFGPVWTILYILMGLALGIIINSNYILKKGAIALFVVQFCLNLLWSFLFFKWHRPDIALIEIIVMLILIFATFLSFREINRTAGLLLVPYLLWVSFATCLNGAIWYLN